MTSVCFSFGQGLFRPLHHAPLEWQYYQTQGGLLAFARRYVEPSQTRTENPRDETSPCATMRCKPCKLDCCTMDGTTVLV